MKKHPPGNESITGILKNTSLTMNSSNKLCDAKSEDVWFTLRINLIIFVKSNKFIRFLLVICSLHKSVDCDSCCCSYIDLF